MNAVFVFPLDARTRTRNEAAFNWTAVATVECVNVFAPAEVVHVVDVASNP